MKKLSRFAIITFIIFLFMIAAASIAVKPIYNKLETAVDTYTEKLCKIITDYTGLNLTYESFSPSILSSFRIKKIKLADTEDKSVLEIKKIKVTYRLKELFSGNYDRIVRNVSVNGVDMDLSRIVDIVMSFPMEESSGESTFDANLIFKYIPANISVKNVNIFYDHPQAAVTIPVKDISIVNSRRKNCIEFQVNGKVSVYVKGVDMTFAGNVNANGTLYDTIENSIMYAKLSDWNNGSFRLSRINALATYAEGKIEAHTIQTVNPFFANLVYDLETMDFDATIKTDYLNPYTVLSDMPGYTTLSVLRDLRLTATGDIHVDGETLAVDYKSSGRVNISEKLFPGALAANYRLTGNDRALRVTSLTAEGRDCEANANLNLVFNTLQVDGYIGLDRYTLPNGKNVATEIFIDSLSEGFMAFAPQVMIGDKYLTALEGKLLPGNDSYDFEVTVSDYSEINNGDPGSITVDGSYIVSSNYVQANATLDSLSVGSIIEYIQELTDENLAASLNGAKSFLNPFVFSGDAYISSDLTSISYNVPYIVVANTQNESQYLFASANGNEQSLQINRFDLIFGKYALTLECSYDMNPATKDGFFMADMTFSQIPYHLSGAIMQNVITLSGDYGVDAEVRIGKDNSLEGKLYIDSLPFILDKISLLFSLDSTFAYDGVNGPDVKVSRLEIKENVKGTADEPKLLMAGSGTKYGTKIDSIAYTDVISAMFGYADITYNFTDGIFNSLNIDMDIKNQLSDEQVTLKADLSNPNNVAFSSQDILNSLYINTDLDIRHFSLNRFLPVSNEDNELTAEVSVTGTIAHPYAVVNMKKMAMLMSNYMMTATGSMFLEDRTLSVERLRIEYFGVEVDNFTGSMSLETMNGKFNAICDSYGIVVPLTISLYDAYIPEGGFVPESLMITVSSDKISGDLIKKNVGFDITAVYTKDVISFFSSDNLGLVGTYIPSSGEVYGSINSENIMALNVEGKVTPLDVNLKLSNINVNLNKFLSYFAMDDYFTVESGILKGSLTMGGNMDTPEFRGALSVTSPKVYLPTVTPYVLSTDKLLIAAANNEITLREDTFSLKNIPRFKFGAKIFLDKWIVDSVEAKFTTIKNEYIPLNLKTPYLNLSGEVTCDLDLLYSDYVWDINGKVFGEKIDVVSNLTDAVAATTAPVADNPKTSGPVTYYRTDLDVTLGTHVMLNFNPLLRCIFVPNTKIGIKVDTETENYVIDGQLGLKSGDVSYLSRNFYIKEGNLKFNTSDLTNPLITLKAETRERDDSGKNVTIILSAENQYLKDFAPRFTSIPAKSEAEILNLLGQIVVADAGTVSDISISLADYAFQSTVVRGVENKLRDLMNFDIFSIRTNVLQNTLNMGTSGNLSRDDITIGNFLDNSTVYIGKYLGSALYVDAMLRFSLENGGVTDPTKANGFLFQPEFGLELELPIANIRWNMAPDIRAMMGGQYVPSTSVSLSWEFQF